MSYTKQTWQTGDTITAEKLNHIEEGIESADGGAVSDVQIDGTSVLSGGVANIPRAGLNQSGVIKVSQSYGFSLNGSGALFLNSAGEAVIKAGSNNLLAISPNRQHASTFYGLAKAAGDTTQSQSSNPVGTYTEEAKTAIKSMLGITGGGMNIVSLTGTQITQVGADNTFYVCGELTELTFTAPAVGITMIRFTSGTTPTVLTVNGATGWMFGFDTTALEANKVYDLSFLNGLGCAGWA